jgi:lysophospholipase L1-like esterase
LDKAPNVVVIWVGVNDVWHKSMMGTGTDYDKFGLFYDAVVQKIQAKGAKVILVTPAVIGERNDHSNPQDGELNLYAKWIRQYAAQKNIALVDCRKLFLEYSTKNNPKQVYTYKGNTNTKYKKDKNGNWYINSGSKTNNKFVKIDDPTGKRSKELDANATKLKKFTS